MDVKEVSDSAWEWKSNKVQKNRKESGLWYLEWENRQPWEDLGEDVFSWGIQVFGKTKKAKEHPVTRLAI